MKNKFFATRDRETDMFVDWSSAENEWFLSQTFGILWVDTPPSELTLARISSQLKNEYLLEVVTLRIEPTEPCEWCEHIRLIDNKLSKINHDGTKETITASEWNLCPNCGRSLK